MSSSIFPISPNVQLSSLAMKLFTKNDSPPSATVLSVLRMGIIHVSMNKREKVTAEAGSMMFIKRWY